MREDGHVLKMALDFEVEGLRKKGRLVEEESMKVYLSSKWSVGVKKNCCWVGVNLASLTCWGCYHILNIGVSLLRSLKLHSSEFVFNETSNPE